MGIRDGLERTIEWTRENEAMIGASIAKHDLFMTQWGQAQSSKE
jgi:hypothetical protein